MDAYYASRFDAGLNGYGDKTRGGYATGTIANGDLGHAWFAGKDLSAEKYLAVHLYVDDPDEFKAITMELASTSFDVKERNWTFTADSVKLKKGWNVISLDLNNAAGKSAKGTIGYTGTDVGGTYDPGNIQFFRVNGTYAGQKIALGAIHTVASVGGGVQTGDATNIVLIVGALMLACAAAATATFCGKKARAN